MPPVWRGEPAALVACLWQAVNTLASAGGQTTGYVGNHYEYNINTGVATSTHYAGSTRVAMRQGGVVSYLHGDHLGSASLTTNASGNQISEQRYYPYGATRSGSSPTDRQFNGQRNEIGLGLYDYGARMYDSVLGRFLSADTIVPSPGNPQSLNRYSYVLNSPLRYVDPTGHMETEGGSNGTWTPPPLRPDIFVGDSQDVATAWFLLDKAQEYGPNTRQFIESHLSALSETEVYGNGSMKIRLVRNVRPVVGGSFKLSAIDLADIARFPDDRNNPASPTIVMLHEFTEQYAKQIGGLATDGDYYAAHDKAIDAENMANTERYGYPVARSRSDRSPSIIYDASGLHDIGGRTQAWVTLSIDPFSVTVMWRRP